MTIRKERWGTLQAARLAAVKAMNAADYLSKGFQSILEKFGWEKEKTIAGQRIDGYCEKEIEAVRYWIPREKFISFIDAYWKEYPTCDIVFEFSKFFYAYHDRGVFALDELGEKFHYFFEGEKVSRKFRIGLEFETGNIASAFRALEKLDGLFRADHIDVGVFITSHNKEDVAAKIWPSANRNASFVELENREYKKSKIIPLCEFSFQPDDYRPDVRYLQEDGGLYFPEPTGRTKIIEDSEYEIYIRPHDKEEVLKKIE